MHDKKYKHNFVHFESPLQVHPAPKERDQASFGLYYAARAIVSVIFKRSD